MLISVGTIPTSSEILEPKSMRVRMSRPASSVPNGWERDGGESRCIRSIWSKRYGVRTGAKTAARIRSTMITKEAAASLFSLAIRRRRSLKRSSSPSCAVRPDV